MAASTATSGHGGVVAPSQEVMMAKAQALKLMQEKLEIGRLAKGLQEQLEARGAQLANRDAELRELEDELGESMRDREALEGLLREREREVEGLRAAVGEREEEVQRLRAKLGGKEAAAKIQAVASSICSKVLHGKLEKATQKAQEATQKVQEATLKADVATQKAEEAIQLAEVAAQKAEEMELKSKVGGVQENARLTQAKMMEAKLRGETQRARHAVEVIGELETKAKSGETKARLLESKLLRALRQVREAEEGRSRMEVRVSEVEGENRALAERVAALVDKVKLLEGSGREVGRTLGISPRRL